MTLEEIRFLIAATSIIGIAMLLFTTYWEGKQHDAETAGIPADAETDETAIQYAVHHFHGRRAGAHSNRNIQGVTQ